MIPSKLPNTVSIHNSNCFKTKVSIFRKKSKIEKTQKLSKNCQKVPIFSLYLKKKLFLKSNLGLRKSFLNQTTNVLKNWLHQQSFLNRDSFLNQAFLNRDSTVLTNFLGSIFVSDINFRAFFCYIEQKVISKIQIYFHFLWLKIS